MNIFFLHYRLQTKSFVHAQPDLNPDPARVFFYHVRVMVKLQMHDVSTRIASYPGRGRRLLRTGLVSECLHAPTYLLRQ